MATAKRRAGKKAGSKKTKGAAEAAPEKRKAQRKTQRKAPAAAKKAPARKAKSAKKPVRKTAARTGKVSRAKKASAGKSPARKSPAKKTVVKKTAAKKGAAKKGAAKNAVARKAPAKKTAVKARKPAAKPIKAAAKKPVAATPRAATRPSGRNAVGAVARPPRAKPGGRSATSARRPAVTATRKPKGARGIAISGPMGDRYEEILTPAALDFLAGLHRKFDGRRKALLKARVAQQARYDAGEVPDFRADTRAIRDGDWKVAPIPGDLLDRRVEITGPVDRKMVINALNSGASMYMADFEDANSPTWSNNIEGQINMKDRWAGTIDFTDARGKEYKVGEKTATLIIRPRGWHLEEAHLKIDGNPISGGLFDFGLYFFHNAKTLLEQGTRPYFYIPKLETYEEAQLWNDVFVHAQEQLGLPTGLIKCTVLIETLPAAFQMDEILYALREHIAGLNAGRWDYIFSFIKKLAKNPNYILPDRGQVVMGKAFLGAYAALLVKTCHHRGAFAMGGMAAQIPVKNNPKANDEAFARVKADKEREARDGHDGTWVAHPDLVPVAREVFDRMMPQPNQLDKRREDVHVTRDDLLRLHEGTRTEEGFRHNIRVGVQYIEAWLRGRGAVPIYNLMEDAATAEISRAQIWQWVKYGVELEGGVKATPQLFRRAMKEEMARVREELGAEYYDQGRFPEAIKLFTDLSLADEFEDFLTIPAYRMIA